MIKKPLFGVVFFYVQDGRYGRERQEPKRPMFSQASELFFTKFTRRKILIRVIRQVMNLQNWIPF